MGCNILVPFTLMFLLSQSVFARLSPHLAKALVRTVLGQELVAGLSGRSVGQIGKMGLLARENLLMEALRKNRELSSELSQIAYEAPFSANHEAVVKDILRRINFYNQETESVVIPPSQAKTLMDKIRGESLSARLKDFQRANLKGVNLRGANLIGINLKRAYLTGVNLEGANLEGVNLEGANLIGTNLKRVNLEGANLEGANLIGAYLEGADLIGAIS